MSQVLHALTERRSIRRYEDRQIPDSVLDQILQAASYSPNAGGRQTTQVVVCQNRNINERLGRINRDTFVQRGNKVSDSQPSIADDHNLKNAFYDAPTVITLFSCQDSRYAEADCWIMANNIALAAHALGVSSCIVGRTQETFEGEFGQELLVQWGIPQSLAPKAHVVLGYAKGEPATPKPRTLSAPIVIR